MGKVLLLVVVLGLLMIGCASRTLEVRPPPADFSTSCNVLKDVEGTGGGLLFWGIIPLGVNGRFDNAYQEALGSVGGTHLIDVKVVETGGGSLTGLAVSARSDSDFHIILYGRSLIECYSLGIQDQS